MNGPGSQNEFAKSAGEMNIPMQLDNKDYGKKVKAVARKVNIKSSGKDGKFYGARTIMTKEDGAMVTFTDYLLMEGDELTTIPERLIGEIKSNIKKGANDMTQKWKDAIELCHTAFKVTNVRRPQPTHKTAWKQYESLLRDAVHALRRARGAIGDWRKSKPMVVEFAQREDSGQHIGKKRFFVEIPGQSSTEIDGKTLDEIIDMMGNKMRRHGAKIRIEQRNKFGAILTVWVDEVKRDRILIKEVS